VNTSSSNPPGPIIIGVDSSDQSKAALDWAVDHAVEGQAVHAIHAVSPAAELARAVVGVHEAPRRDQVPYTSIVGDDPAQALISKADSYGGSMIVVGPHGDGKSRSLGRVTRALLHALPVPVVVARPTPDDTSSTSRVLVAVGYGAPAEAAIDWAAEYAQRFGHSLELLHVVGYRPVVPLSSPPDMLASYIGGSTPTDWASSQLEEHADAIGRRYPELATNCVVDRGSVVQCTLKRTAGAALVVLGQSRLEPATRNLMASRTLGIVSRADTSVAIIPS